MKVAIFASEIKQREGGAYTFAHSLLASLERAAASSEHEFVVLHEGPSAIEHATGSMQRFDLASEQQKVLTPVERALRRLPRMAERISKRIFEQIKLPDWRTRVCRNLGIQFVLSLSQWNSIQADIPFGIFVWDLQHRNNPWFPETSDSGQWTAREENMLRQCQRAALIFTGTRQGAEEVEYYYRAQRDRIKVLPFCTPQFALDAAAAPARPDLLREFKLPAKYVLYPAQFWPHKNHAVILEAMNHLKALGLGIVFVGSDQGNTEFVRRYAVKLGIDSQTKFLGFVEQSILVELYKHAVAMVFPTYCGPDNLPPLEAFALSCPVIASAVPGAQEQLGDAALLFPPSDDLELARHIQNLYDDAALRQRLIIAGREIAIARNWNVYAAGLLAALDEFAKIRRAWGN